jgi:uncharacterized protein YoxC
MNLEHAIIALIREVHALTEEVHILTGRVDVLTGRVDILTEQVNHHSEELRRQGVMIEHLDTKIEVLIDGYGALDKKIEDFRDEVNGKFKEIDYKFEAVFEDVGVLRKELYGFCRS